MRISHDSRRRWLVVAVFALSFSAIVFLTVFLLPGQTLAQETGPVPTEPAGDPGGPPPPAPIRSPVQAPDPEKAGPSAAELAASNELEATRFRPKIQIQKGQPIQNAPGGEKPVSQAAARQKAAGAGSFGPQEPYRSPDINAALAPLGWNLMLNEGFEGIFPGNWILEDYSNDGREIFWGDTAYKAQVGSWSIWAADGGADRLDPYTQWYTDNLSSWIEYEFDFSGLTDVFVSYGLWYDTEPAWDWTYFCISTDFQNYSCDYWSGYSDGWTDQAKWLTTYAGYDRVWLAWIFESDSSISRYYEGPFVDEVWVWGYAPEASTPPPTAGNQLINFPSFENGGTMPTAWQIASSSQQSQQSPLTRSANAPTDDSSVLNVGITDQTWVEGAYAAVLWRNGGIGQDYLYQLIDISNDTDDVVLDLWQAITTNETVAGQDAFCTSLMTANRNRILVDLGCTDAVDALGSWQQVVYTLNDAELTAVKGRQVALVFELYNQGAADSGTAGWVDFVNVYAVGGSNGSSNDLNEPNDESTQATSLACDTTITGTIGEAAGGYDIDWFVLNNVPVGRMDIDIAADTQVPPSELDSVVYLYDSGLNQVAWNDDDGVSFDSYITHTNSAANATYYVSVESYSGYGSLDSFYDLDVRCNVNSNASGGGGTATIGGGTPISWTVMLYLNAEDAGFESILTQYRTDIEKFIGGKSDFLKVLILYDGPGDGDTVRYEVQPNGNYTTGTNRWNLGEVNMGHPDTLANFVTWAQDRYPAANYYLAIDDHGDGAYGISIDGTSNNDILTAPDVYAALKSATHNGAADRKIDIFDYEACLMGLAENAYDVREWVSYVVFFEQISWGLDTYPDYFRDLSPSDSPVTVGRRIIDRYHSSANAAYGSGLPHTISLIDTSQMDAVRQAVSNLASALMTPDTQARKNAITNRRNLSQGFANDNDATDPRRAEYIDLWDLAHHLSDLAPAQANAVKQAVDNAVVAQGNASGGVSGFIWNHSGAHGMSIYYPISKQSNAFGGYDTSFQMSHQGGWDEFLEWVLSDTGRRGMFAARAEDKLLGDGAGAFVFKYAYLPLTVKGP